MATSFGMDDADAFGAGDADAFVAPIPFGAGDTDAFGAEDEEAFSADRSLAERFGFDSVAADLMGREAFGVKPDVPFEQQPAGARYVSIPLGQGIASARQGISTGASMAHSDRVRILDNIDIMERLQDRKNYVGPGGLFNEPAYQRDLDRVSDLWSPQHPAINPLDPGAYAAHINEPEISQYAATRDPARRQAIRERIRSVVAGTLRNVAEQERVLRSYPVDPSLQALNEAKTFGDAAGVIWDDPSLLIRLAVQSAPASATMAGGAILAGPAGAGAGSFVIERGGAILDSFREVGVDVSDPDALSTAFQSPSIVAAAKEAGLKRGLPIALFDALAGGVASKTIFRNKAGDLAAQTGFQAGTGGAGEATAQLVERGEVYAPGAVVAEVGAEVVTGAPEAAAIGAGSGKYRAEAKQAAPQAGEEEGPSLPGGALPGEALYGATPGVPAALPEPQGRPDSAAELRQLLGDERSLEAILDENRRLQEARQTAARLRELTRQRQALQQQNLGGRFATQIAEVSGQIGQIQRGAPELIGLAKQAQALSRQNIGGRYTQQLAELNREIGQIRQRMGLVKGDGTAGNPLALRDGDDIGVGVALTQEPTPAQAEAGNYRKRHLRWQGLEVSIETEAGQMRRGVGADGKPWEVEMPVPYGYVRGTEGRDGDQVDVYLGPKPELGTVFLIDQIDPKTRRFDEHKAMIGFESADQAGAAYDAAFSDFRGPQRIGAVTTMTADQFKDWLRKANTKRPVAYVNPARHRKPTDLLAFLISRGGIRDTGGELAAMDAGKRRPGLINNATGMDLDHAREIAEEAGYIRPAQADTTTSINDLVVAVDASLRGRRIVTDADIKAEWERVRQEDSEKERARYDDVLQEVRDVAGRLGYVRLTANEVREAALLTMGGMDPEDALVDVVTRVAQATIEEETTGETVEATAEQSPLDVVAADKRPRETAAPAREPAGEDVREPEGGAAPSGDQPGRGGDQPGREGPVGLLFARPAPETTTRSLGFPAASHPIADFTSDKRIKAHRDYTEAKAGDNAAAVRLVRHMVKPSSLAAARKRFGGDVLYVPVIAVEANGHNAIPRTLAEHYAAETGGETAFGIEQVSRAFHTGARPMERMVARPVFDGRVERGRRYVIVDDVSVMGSTIAELADYIRRNGGEVAGAVLLVNAGRSGVLSAPRAKVRLIERRFGDEVREIFGIEPAALTADEADYLGNFKDADQLRTTVATALRQRDARLRSKGLPPEGGGGVADTSSPPKTAAPKGAADVSGQPKPSLALDLRRLGRSTQIKPLGRHMRASYDPARGAARRELQRRVAALVEQFAGAGLVDVAVADRLWQVHEGGKTQPIHGGFAPGEALIAIALDSPDPLPIAHHEIIHLMREMDLIPEHHWRVLERAADADWMTRYRIEERYPDLTHEQQLEEAVADAFREFRSGKSPTEDVTVASILRRLQILVMRVVAAIKRAWNGVPGDFDAKANLIFRDIERGLYRIPVQDEPGVGENAPPKDYDFKAVRMTEEEAEAFAAEQERDTGWGWHTLKQRGVDGSTYWIAGTAHVPVEATGGQMTEQARTTRAVFTSAERDPRAAASLPPALQKAQAAQRVKAAGEQRKKEVAKRYQIGDDKAKPVTEQTDQDEQLVIPGAEKISNRELVERRAAGKAAAKKPQKGIEDLPLFDTPKKQTDLFKAARQEVVRRETHAVQRRNAMMGWITRGQPIDRAIRMPFSFMGGVDAQGKWNAGKLLYERHPGIVTGALIGARAGAAISNPLGAVVGRVAGKAVAGQAGAQLGEAAAALTGGLPGAMAGAAIGGGVGALFDARFDPNGRFNFMNPILESARIGLIDRYGLSDEYLTADRKRALDERRIVMQAVEILKTLKEQGIATEEAKVLQAILTGEKVDNEAMNKLAQPIREAIDALGQEAVHLGLISAEAFERNRGAYLHRLYLKHEMDQDTLGRWAGRFLTSYRKRIIGHELKGRGLFFDERMGRLMRDVPGWPEGTAPSAVKGQKFLMLDRIPEQEELEGIGAREDVKVIDRVFWPANKPIPPRYQDYTDRGTWEVREVRGGKVTIWRDFTKKEREQMGEILDARYTIAKTFMLLGHDLATGRFYKDISENEAWTQTEEPSEKWRDASEYGYRLWADDSIEWVKVPEAEIPGTGGKKKWGALSGKFVRAEIWRDINELAILQRSNFWRRQLTTWKKNKTARSPVVHMNNIMSNFLLMDMADVRMQDLVAGLRAYIRKDGDYQDAADHGVFGVDMVSQELRRDVLEPLLKDIRIEILKQQTTVQTKAGMLSLLAERIHGAYRNMDRGMLQAYQIEDDVFRMAAYMRHKSTGLSPEDAAAAAREEFIDYDIRAPWIVAARNSLLPFISYTYRAAPLVARMVATRPWKFAKYASIAYAMGALAYMIAPGDEDDERKSLRDEEQGHTWMGTPQMMRMPFRDPYGNPVFFDSRRWIPAGDVFDMGRGQAAVPVPAPLLFGGPIMLGAELALDKSAFTGEPIVPPYATPMERTKAVADHVYKSWMPSAPWVPGSWYWEKVGKSVNSRLGLDWAENIGWGTEPRDALGRPLLPQFEIPSAFGVKLKPQDVEFGLQMHRRDIRKETDDLRARERQLGKDLERQMISQETYDAKIKELEERMERLGKRMEYYESGSTAEAP